MRTEPRCLLPFVLLAAGFGGCAALRGETVTATAPPLPHKVIFDVDLTTGSAGPGAVTGGSWDHGWRVTQDKGERIVFDAGQPIKAGYFEVSFTMSRRPHEGPPRKIDWVGMFEDQTLSQAASSGDIFYARVGDPKYKFSRVKAGGRKFDDTEWEKSVGDEAEWKADDKTVQTVRLEWRGGVAIFRDTKNKDHACSKKLCDPKNPIDRLRYATIGSDRYTDLSLVGLRFVRAKLVEYVPTAQTP